MPTGDTALMTAAFNGHEEVVRVLLEAKVNTAAKDKGGQGAAGAKPGPFLYL